ncbi:HAD-IIB family hydrolase [Oceanobacter mangrovi]|uniref:HAD-IIB family hydrolase n=1 Tax=Oceanobacter mangrovi TaxID=2862510 RepID=UPI001C8F15A4|nr:HAD-IIB family hydrolase [Oceanobacter mangrovi]
MTTQSRVNQPAIALVVITDLDGTLLDHFNYSAAAAQPALKRLRKMHIPVVFNTSKTCDEVAGLRHELDNTDPFVCENGSVIHIPKSEGGGYNSEILGTSYVQILKVLHHMHQQGFHFRGFNDMPASEVAALTGLPQDKAWLSKKRAASEPIIWHDSDDALTDFRNQLEAAGLQLTKGGRFYHVMGQADKASGLAFARDFYQHLWDQPVKVVALGDGENDRAMLEAADYPIVIPGEKQTLSIDNPNAVTAPRKGPAGWNHCIIELLEKLQ